jgi:hypothetical protein
MSPWLAIGIDTNSISANPLFTSAVTGNFQPLPTSPALIGSSVIGALVDIIRADVDQQNGINTTDARLTLIKSLGLSMSGTNWKASSTTGDVNCDNKTNLTDAMLILRHSSGLSMGETGWCIQ